ncbi:MAG TPA: helix-turn-helix transcriptional regulator, partial [Candidatus Saccharimonadales bacterium]
MDNLQLGLAIKSAREAAKLTQDDLSDRAGLAYSTLAKIEQGAIKNPSFSTILALSRALNLSIEQLLGAKPANVRV